MRGSNHLIGTINFLTFLLSIPILGGGIWLSSKANSTDCMRFLQWPLIIIGVSIMVISLAGFAGACYRNTALLWFYLFAMFFIIAALIGFIIFAYVVTSKGSGRPVINRGYRDYYLFDYSGWLQRRVSRCWLLALRSDPASEIPKGLPLRWLVLLMASPESADMFYLRKLKPSSVWDAANHQLNAAICMLNETLWDSGGGMVGASTDCSRWSNEQGTLCYNCDSCKAGVLASLRKSWRKVSVINIIVLIILVIVYVIGCAAFRNNKRMDNDEAYGEGRMTKSQPSRIHF